MKNRVLKIILGIILAACFVGGFFVMSIIDLTNKKDVYDVEITEAYDFLAIEHSMNGIIPIGTDYYYLCLTENDDAYIIKESKNWLSNNFDEQGVPNGGVYNLHGLAKRESDYDVSKELASRMVQVEDYCTPALDYGIVVNPKYVRNSIVRIVTGILLVIEAVAAYLLRDTFKNLDPKIRLALVAVLLITLMVGLRFLI